MIYKKKVLILHRNSLIQERLSAYLRENNFAVIVANNVESTLSLTQSMKPDIILWGESLTAHAKEIIHKLKTSRFAANIPVIAMVPDLELFDRIEVEKIGISDLIDSLPNFTDLKVKIRLHLANRRKQQAYEKEIHQLQNITELQYNLIRLQDVNRLCELVNDHLFSTYEPDVLITLVYNRKTREYDYKSYLCQDKHHINLRETIYSMPIWQKYYFARNDLNAERLSDEYILNYLRTVGLQSNMFYQFPLKASNHNVGIILMGMIAREELPRREFNRLKAIVNSLAFRIVSLRHVFTGTPRVREETSEIKDFFQRLNEDEISDYLSHHLMSLLNADICIYFNYNEGFRFLYPQYCYKTGDERNLFEHEKPPVLLVKDYPTFEGFLDSRSASAAFNSNDPDTADLVKMAGLAGGEYNSILLFSVTVGNEIKGFFVLGNDNAMKRFTNAEIQTAEQAIQKATNVLVESRVVRQAQKTLKQLDRIFELSKELTLESEIHDLLNKIAQDIRRTLGWNVVILDKLNTYTNRIENVCMFGLKKNQYQELKKNYAESMLESLKEKCFPISNSYFYDYDAAREDIERLDEDYFENSIGKEWNDNDWVLVPIMTRGQELGYIAVNDRVERVRPTENKVRSLEYFANQAAVALENAALYQDIKTSEEKYRLLAETMTMGLVTCDFSGRIIYVNQSLANFLKYKQSTALIGQSIYDLCSAKSRGEFEKHVLKILKYDSREDTEIEAVKQGIDIELMSTDNQFIPFRIFLTPYMEQSSKAGFIGVLSDLRPQMKLERLKADFNSMIVHDLRSPLNIIQGYIDIVRNQVVGSISSEQSELLFIAKDNVDKVLKLIDNFMIASKLEAGKFKLNYEVHSINALVEAVYEHHMILAKNKGLEMSLQLDQKISLQQFDRLRIEQVLNNYVSNAIKFTPKGGKITLYTKLVKEHNELTGKDSMAVHVAIQDTGVGISPEETKKVFSKYEQTEAGKDASLKGTGLGLAICKEIISLHKGRVWVKSQPGEGSTFFFSLPVNPIKV